MRSHVYYYWISTKDEQGKPYLIYGGSTEDEARQRGFDALGGLDFEIKPLPTRNLQAASSMLKGNRLDETHSLKESTRKLGHDRSLKRLKRKQDNTGFSFPERTFP